MTTYGIFVVPPDWHEGKTATIDKTTFQYHGEELEPGTRLLLYMKEPVDAIVGEAEVTGMIVPPDPMAQSDADASTHHARQHSHRADTSEAKIGAPELEKMQVDQRTYEVPYRILRSKANTRAMPLGTIKARLGSDFSIFDEEWFALSEAQYKALVSVWSESKA